MKETFYYTGQADDNWEDIGEDFEDFRGEDGEAYGDPGEQESYEELGMDNEESYGETEEYYAEDEGDYEEIDDGGEGYYEETGDDGEGYYEEAGEVYYEEIADEDGEDYELIVDEDGEADGESADEDGEDYEEAADEDEEDYELIVDEDGEADGESADEAGEDYEAIVDEDGEAGYDSGEYYGKSEDDGGEYYGRSEDDNGEYYGEAGYGDGEYYGKSEDDNGEYYGEAGYDDGEYYGEAGDGGGEYYGEAGYDSGEYYGEVGYDGEEYYGEPGYDGEEYYGETGYDGEGYYEESGDEGEAYYGEVRGKTYSASERDGGSGSRKEGRGVPRQRLGKADRIMLGLGGVIILLMVVLGGVYLREKAADRQAALLAAVGAQVEGIEVIGERGLLAVADATMAKIAAAELLEQQKKEEEERQEQQKEYNENEYSKSVTVTLKMVSVQRDLKIKFINKSTDKLISNTPFSVSVTTGDKKTEIWSDDDMDGIIYKKNIAAGEYKVAVNELPSSYKGYILPQNAQKTEVKKEIVYEKIDVSDEVRKESQINVATEEQKKEEPVVESVLTDTVKWVESTCIPETYIEVAKGSIKDPMPTDRGTAMASVSPGDAVQLVQVDTVAGTGVPEGIVYVGTSVTVAVAATNIAPEAVMSAASSDPGIAAVSVNGQSVTVSGVSAGTATITARFMDEGVEQAYAIWTLTVSAHPGADSVTPLTDKEGNALFVPENDTYRAAVIADYFKENVKLFRKGSVRYTGWQTIDGKVYYFNESGQMMTGEQVIQGARYHFASDGSLVTGSGTMGIDVSKHNGDIDWNAVKNSGVSYVIIRCGYRGYTKGALIEDPNFEKNVKGASAAGLKVGVYFFSQAVDEVEAVAEASFVLNAVSGHTISYPIFLDVEYSGAAGHKGRADGLDKASRTAVCKAFCATIQSYGYTAGIYANKTWLEEKIDSGQLGAYKIWLAQYAADPTYAGRYDLWQYKSTGQVSGIKGNVDLNLSYLGY